MAAPIYDPERVLNLRVEPDVKRRLDALLARVSTGAARLSRHGLAVWCLERGLLEAERDAAAVLRAPAAAPVEPARAAPPRPVSVAAPSEPPAGLEAPPGSLLERELGALPGGSSPRKGPRRDAADDALRERLNRVRELGDAAAVSWAALHRATGVQDTGIMRFARGEKGLVPKARAALEREVARLEAELST